MAGRPGLRQERDAGFLPLRAGPFGRDDGGDRLVVMVVIVGGDRFEWGWGGAAVGSFAAADLELDGGVVDVEAVAE
jgi:hypothetical protein